MDYGEGGGSGVEKTALSSQGFKEWLEHPVQFLGRRKQPTEGEVGVAV